MTPTYMHTPGPWRHDWQFIVAPDPASVHPDIYIAEIAETDEDGRVASPEQQEANKRLIAEAPALLTALDTLITATADLDAAIDGVTDQFDAERRALERAIAQAQTVLATVAGGAA